MESGAPNEVVAVCATCRFWDRHMKKDKELGFGECRRYAPRPVIEKLKGELKVVEQWSSWLSTADSDWCGEWEKEK